MTKPNHGRRVLSSSRSRLNSMRSMRSFVKGPGRPGPVSPTSTMNQGYGEVIYGRADRSSLHPIRLNPDSIRDWDREIQDFAVSYVERSSRRQTAGMASGHEETLRERSFRKRLKGCHSQVNYPYPRSAGRKNIKHHCYYSYHWAPFAGENR